MFMLMSMGLFFMGMLVFMFDIVLMLVFVHLFGLMFMIVFFYHFATFLGLLIANNRS